MERVEVTDEWLYKYMPVVDAEIIQELECLVDKDYEFSRKFKRQMKHLISREAHPWIWAVKNLMKRVAVFFVGVIGIALIFTMSVEAYRKKIFETIKTYFDDRVIYDFSVTDQSDMQNHYIPSYIPNGYKEIERFSSEINLSIVYENEEGKLIIWEQMLVTEAAFVLLDTEYDCYENVEIDGRSIDIFLYDSGFVGAYYECEQYVFTLTADYLSIEEVICMLDSIVLLDE